MITKPPYLPPLRSRTYGNGALLAHYRYATDHQCICAGELHVGRLALNRLVSAQASTLTFDRPKDFDLQKYDADGHFGFGEGNQIRLTFRIDKSAGLHLLESPLSLGQQVQGVGDQLEITAAVVETAQLEWWLRGFGEQVSVVRRVPILGTEA